MKKYITILTAVAGLTFFSCTQSREPDNTRSEADARETPSDSTYESSEYQEMEGDVEGSDRNTGSFGSPGSGYGTENESGTAASGTSAPADNAAGDRDERSE